MKPRRVVYRVCRYNGVCKKTEPYALVYNDGSLKSLFESYLGLPAKLMIEGRKNQERMWKLSMDMLSDRWLHSILAQYCASQEENDIAFATLCKLLESGPPFHGYKIKYYGKGEPWILNPDWSEGKRY